MVVLYGFLILGFLSAYGSAFWIAVNALADSESFRKSPEAKRTWTSVVATLSALCIVLFISFVMGSRALVYIAARFFL